MKDTRTWASDISFCLQNFYNYCTQYDQFDCTAIQQGKRQNDNEGAFMLVKWEISTECNYFTMSLLPIFCLYQHFFGAYSITQQNSDTRLVSMQKAFSEGSGDLQIQIRKSVAKRSNQLQVTTEDRVILLGYFGNLHNKTHSLILNNIQSYHQWFMITISFNITQITRRYRKVKAFSNYHNLTKIDYA